MSAAAGELTRRVGRALLWRRLPWALAAALPWLALASALGTAVWALWLALQWWLVRRQVARDGLRWLDAAVPALEDSSALLLQAATPLGRLQQQRLQGRIHALLAARVPQQVGRTQARAAWRHDAGWLCFSVAAALAVWAAPGRKPDAAAVAAAAPAAAAPASLMVHVTPPAYTGLAAFDTLPRELLVPAQSTVRWCLQTAAPAAASQPPPEPVELSDGTRLPLSAGCASWQAAESIFWRWHGTRHTLRVRPDEPPVITVRSPDEPIRTLAGAGVPVQLAITVQDDYRVAAATLHLTLARGSGENVRFSDREMPLPQGSDPRVRQWQRNWLPAELGMEPGDELYFFVRASDNAAPRPHTSTSPTYTLRLPGPLAEAAEASALPVLVKPESLRSQRQIVIDTEQLLADMKATPRLAPARLRARSEDIAADQAQLRRRYGQFLGEESSLFGDADDHDHDHQAAAAPAADLTAAYGHRHDQAENATLFDEGTKTLLRRTLAAMWDAEKALRAITPQAALPHELRALQAIKALQQAERIYLHRTAFVPPPLKEDKRLTGDLAGARSYRRAQGAAPAAVAAPVRELVSLLDAGQPLPALWSGTARAWIRERIASDDDRLAAQRAVQDVMDGCSACRAPLRAWLRAGMHDVPVRLQAQQGASTAFTRAWPGQATQ